MFNFKIFFLIFVYFLTIFIVNYVKIFKIIFSKKIRFNIFNATKHILEYKNLNLIQVQIKCY